MIDNAIQYYYLIPIFSALLFAMTFSINHWDITDIEKKFITRFKRLQITVSLILIETIVFAVYLAVVMNKRLLEPYKDIDDIYQTFFLITVTLFCVSLFFILMINISLQIMEYLIVPKIRYYVILEDSIDKWILERTTFHKQILLRNEDGNCILLKEWDNLKFINDDLNLPKLGSWIYKTDRRFNFIMMWLGLSMGSLISWSLLLDKEGANYVWTSNLLIVISLILLTIFFSLLNMKKFYKNR